MNKIEENTSKSGPMAEKEQKRSCEVSITITQGNVNNVTMDLDALLSDLDKVAQQAAEKKCHRSTRLLHTFINKIFSFVVPYILCFSSLFECGEFLYKFLKFMVGHENQLKRLFYWNWVTY